MRNSLLSISEIYSLIMCWAFNIYYLEMKRHSMSYFLFIQSLIFPILKIILTNISLITVRSNLSFYEFNTSEDCTAFVSLQVCLLPFYHPRCSSRALGQRHTQTPEAKHSIQFAPTFCSGMNYGAVLFFHTLPFLFLTVSFLPKLPTSSHYKVLLSIKGVSREKILTS